MGDDLNKLLKDPAILDRVLMEAGAEINGERAHVKCPFHEDDHGSLSLFTDPDTGRARFKCHSCEVGGTAVDAVMLARKCSAGEAIEILTGSNGNGRQTQPAMQPKKPATVYPGLPELLDAGRQMAERRSAELSASYQYEDAAGELVLVAMRLDHAGGKKTFSQARAVPGGLSFGGLECLAPLYHLVSIQNAKAVVVAEGEKCVEQFRALGLLATTSAGGSGAPAKTDWNPLAGRRVIIWPDNDAAGAKYAESVVSILNRMHPRPTVRVVEVEPLALPEAGDVVDYCEGLRQDGKTDDEVRASVAAVLDNAATVEPESDIVPLGSSRDGRRLPSALIAMDTSNDPNALLGRSYIRRGDALLWHAESGAGKSVLATQYSVCLAMGLPFFGIQPLEKLRVLYVQGENADGDVAEMLQGTCSGLNLKNSNDLDARLVIYKQTAATGNDFIRYLDALATVHRPDMIVVDPLFSYIGGDISDQKTCSLFLRGGLNPIAANHGCALTIIHHVKKPSQNSNDRKAWSGSLLNYSSHGSAELVNWPRAILILRETEDGSYELRAGKRGTRAGLRGPTGEESTVIQIRHSSDKLFWTYDSEAVEIAEDAVATELHSILTDLGNVATEAELRAAILKKTKGHRNYFSRKGKPENKLLNIAKRLYPPDEMGVMHFATLCNSDATVAASATLQRTPLKGCMQLQGCTRA